MVLFKAEMKASTIPSAAQQVWQIDQIPGFEPNLTSDYETVSQFTRLISTDDDGTLSNSDEGDTSSDTPSTCALEPRSSGW